MSKRVLTIAIGLPIIILVLIFGNKYVIDVAMALVAFIALNEYYKAIKNEVKAIEWIGYLFALMIAFIHVVNFQVLLIVGCIAIPIILLVLFLHVIITDMRINLKDIAFSFFGTIYILAFLVFIPLIYGIDGPNGISLFGNGIGLTITTTAISGKYLIWILLAVTWGSDICAYLVGTFFGKHKFSKVSPNKTIEGCIGGLVGAVLLTLIYTLAANHFAGLGISYLTIAIIALVLGALGQIGDFAASTIKRYFEIKDFSNTFPGHGGFIDRIDSVMFAAPFAFVLFLVLL